MPCNSVIILPLSDDMDKIKAFRHDVITIACKASEKTCGWTCFCPHEFTHLLRSITQKVRALSPHLGFVSYVQLRQRGRSQLLTTYKNRRVRSYHIIFFFYVNIVFSNNIPAILINRWLLSAWLGSWIMPACTMLKTTMGGTISSWPSRKCWAPKIWIQRLLEQRRGEIWVSPPRWGCIQHLEDIICRKCALQHHHVWWFQTISQGRGHRARGVPQAH